MTDTILTPPAATPPATTPAAPPATPPALAAAPDWAKDWNVAPEVGDWLGKAGFKTPADFASSAMATKKLVGHKPEDIIVRPKDGDQTALVAALRALGAPEKPEGYEFKAGEGEDAAFLSTAAGWFAELGVPKAVAAGLVEKWNEHAKASIAKASADAEADFAKRSEADVAALEAEWGDNYERNTMAAKLAMVDAGLTPEDGKALAQALGLKRATAMLAKFGEHMVESKFKGAGPGSGNFGALTAEQAKAQLGDLRKDAAFMKRWSAGDTEARKQVADLNSVIANAMPVGSSATFKSAA